MRTFDFRILLDSMVRKELLQAWKIVSNQQSQGQQKGGLEFTECYLSETLQITYFLNCGSNRVITHSIHLYTLSSMSLGYRLQTGLQCNGACYWNPMACRVLPFAPPVSRRPPVFRGPPCPVTYGTHTFFLWFPLLWYSKEDATNGAPGIATNGAIGRYERGSWPYY